MKKCKKMRAYLVAELIDGHICWGAVLLHTSLLYLKLISSTQFTRLNRSQASAIDSVNWGLGFSLWCKIAVAAVIKSATLPQVAPEPSKSDS
jgi:hypothetical protein